jgi:ABC-2 type transport system permease protein
MLHDILTVIWKEKRSLFCYRGSRSRFLLVLLTPLLLATVFPWQVGTDWVEEVPSVLLSAVIPLVLVGVTIPEAFAGERERHTLDTLLASRLPDRAILLGKVAVSLLFAWGVTLVVLLLSLVTVNVAHWDGRLLFYTPIIAFADLAVSLIVALLCSGLGILISMRSSTVQEAAQILMAIFLVPLMLVQVVGLVFIDQLRDLIDAVDGRQILAVVLVVLGLLAVGALAAAMARFRRSRLILQ